MRGGGQLGLGSGVGVGSGSGSGLGLASGSRTARCVEVGYSDGHTSTHCHGSTWPAYTRSAALRRWPTPLALRPSLTLSLAQEGTVGAIIAEQTGCDKEDPHAHLSGGAFPRYAQLEDPDPQPSASASAPPPPSASPPHSTPPSASPLPQNKPTTTGANRYLSTPPPHCHRQARAPRERAAPSDGHDAARTTSGRAGRR